VNLEAIIKLNYRVAISYFFHYEDPKKEKILIRKIPRKSNRNSLEPGTGLEKHLFFISIYFNFVEDKIHFSRKFYSITREKIH